MQNFAPCSNQAASVFKGQSNSQGPPRYRRGTQQSSSTTRVDANKHGSGSGSQTRIHGGAAGPLSRIIPGSRGKVQAATPGKM
jgi:hypothetical protein